MRLAILCSGQGGQHAGMFALTGDAPAAADLFDHATVLLGRDPRAWVRDAGDDALHENGSAQLLCTLQALAAAAVLADELPSRRCVAGYSVGEVAAWGVAGVVAPRDALDLIVARANAMDAASRGEQGMLFVRGLGRATIDALVARHGDAAVAIVNPGDAYVLAGMRRALDGLGAEARAQGATRVAPVGVKVASHTRWMRDASTAFRDRLARAALAPVPRGTRLFSGIDGGAVLDVDAGFDKLARQLCEPIQWASCLEACVEAGSTAFLELGPGRALAGMAAGAYPGLPARSLDEFRSLDGVRAWLARLT